MCLIEQLLSRHNVLANVGPQSKTLAQHWINIRPTYCACWVVGRGMCFILELCHSLPFHWSCLRTFFVIFQIGDLAIITLSTLYSKARHALWREGSHYTRGLWPGCYKMVHTQKERGSHYTGPMGHGLTHGLKYPV